MTLDLEALKELAGKSTLNWVEAEKVILAVPALITEVERLREALKPFAAFADVYDAEALRKMGVDPTRYDLSDASTVATGGKFDRSNFRRIVAGDVRRARAALSPTPPADKEG